MTGRLFMFFGITFLGLIATSAEAFYTQDCRVINEDDYVQQKVQTDLKNYFTLTITAFEDEKCEVAYLLIDRKFKIQNLENENLNLLTEKITYTSLSNEVSEALNMVAYCGFKTWKTKVEQNVTGLECDNYLQLKAGQAYYQLLKTDIDLLQLGQETGLKNGRTKATRPDTYDLPFKSQK
jgi:hypothetical protein